MRRSLIVDASGRPMLRDEDAHQRFRRKQLESTKRVLWEFPVLDGIEHRDVRLEDVMEYVKNDPNHPVSLEAARLMKAYLERFRTDLLKMAKHFPTNEQPQVGVTRRKPRWPIEHVAQHLAAVAIQDVIIDATEETALLHPDAPGNEP